MVDCKASKVVFSVEFDRSKDFVSFVLIWYTEQDLWDWANSVELLESEEEKNLYQGKIWNYLSISK